MGAIMVYKPTYNWGAPSCSCMSNIPSYMWVIFTADELGCTSKFKP